MKTVRISYRYAKALFDLAKEKDLVEQVYSDMLSLKNLINSSKDFLHLLESPVISHQKKLGIFRQVFHEKFNTVSYLFLEIILKKRRENIAGDIAFQYVEIYKNFKNIKTVELKTALPAEEKLKNKLKQMLSKQLDAEIEMVETIQPSLLGGFVVLYNNKQFDASIRKNINKLKREYNINIYESKF